MKTLKFILLTLFFSVFFVGNEVLANPDAPSPEPEEESISADDYYDSYYLDLYLPPRAPEPFLLENIVFATGSNGCIHCLYFRDQQTGNIARLYSGSPYRSGYVVAPAPLLYLSFQGTTEYRGRVRDFFNSEFDRTNWMGSFMMRDQFDEIQRRYELKDDVFLNSHIIEFRRVSSKRSAYATFQNILSERGIGWRGASFNGVVLNGQADIDRIYHHLNLNRHYLSDRNTRFRDYNDQRVILDDSQVRLAVPPRPPEVSQSANMNQTNLSENVPGFDNNQNQVAPNANSLNPDDPFFIFFIHALFGEFSHLAPF